jgi:hypothetical protein
MELFGNGYKSGTTVGGDISPDSSFGIMLTGFFSDYLIQDLFIHQFYANIYADTNGWFGRINNCWLEGSTYGLFIKHKQVIASETNISGDGIGIELFRGARDFILDSSHVYSLGKGVYIDQRSKGLYNYIFGNSQFTDCSSDSFEVYAYPGTQVEISVDNSELGQVDFNAQQYAIRTWTNGNGTITFQVDNTKFFPVANAYLDNMAGSANGTSFYFGSTDTGFVTQNTVLNIENTTATTFTFNHGLSGPANSVLCTFNVTGLTYTWTSTHNQATVTVAPVSGNLADLPASIKILAAQVQYDP